MRRLLNLNYPSRVFVEVIGLFLVLIPVVLYGVVLLWNETGTIRTLLVSLIKVSFLLGAFVLIVFLVLILAEQVQDRYFDAKYQKQRGQKVLLTNGYYECQYCGNQRVKENDQICDVCGKEFGSAKSK